MPLPAFADFIDEEMGSQVNTRLTFWTDNDPANAPTSPGTELTSLRTALQGGINVTGDNPPTADLGNTDKTTPQYQNNNGAGDPATVWWVVVEHEIQWSATNQKEFVPIAHAKANSSVSITTGEQLVVDAANTNFKWGDLANDYVPPGSSGSSYHPNYAVQEIIHDALTNEDGTVDGFGGDSYDTLRVIYDTSSTQLVKDFPLTVATSDLSKPGTDGEIIFSNPATVTVSSGDRADGDTLDNVILALHDSTGNASQVTRYIAQDSSPEDVSQTSGPTINAPVDIEISEFRFVI